MRIIIQRVLEAGVTINNDTKSAIGAGLLLFVGFEPTDGQEDIEWLCRKAVQLRLFDDDQGIANLSVKETGGDILVVSQFTLHATSKKGNKPSYIRAARPEIALPLYEQFLKQLEADLGKMVYSGKFGADMKVHLVNDGPVTIWMDTKNRE